MRATVTANLGLTRVLFQCRLRFPCWPPSRTADPTPIEARTSHCARVERPSRPRNSFGPSYRPPHDERRRRGASVVTRLGGGAAPSRMRMRRGKRAGVPSSVLAAGPVAYDRRLVALGGARVLGDLRELGPVARVRRLARPLPSCYAARNFSAEKTVPRDSM